MQNVLTDFGGFSGGLQQICLRLQQWRNNFSVADGIFTGRTNRTHTGERNLTAYCVRHSVCNRCVYDLFMPRRRGNRSAA